MKYSNKLLLGVLRCSTKCDSIFDAFLRGIFCEQPNSPVKIESFQSEKYKEYVFSYLDNESSEQLTHTRRSYQSSKHNQQFEFEIAGKTELLNKINKHITNFGIFHTENIKKNSHFLYKFLTPDEITIYNRYSKDKGKMEFLGGRILTKLCIMALCYSESNLRLNPLNINIIKENNGKPKLIIKKGVIFSVNVSISHKIDYILCGSCKNSKLGLDVEKISNRLLNIKQYFLSDKEEKVLIQNLADDKDKNDMLSMLAMVWSSKESAVKYTESNFFSVAENLKLIDIVNNDFIFKLNDNLNIISHNYEYNNYIFSVITD